MTKFTLRRFRKEDWKALQKYGNHKAIAQHMLDMQYPFTPSMAKRYVAKHQTLAKKKIKNEDIFVIDVDKEAVGTIGFVLLEQDHKKGALGYWLGQPFWGKGIMTKALKQITTYGFQTLKLRRVYAHLFPENKGSIRALEKAGFKFEARLKNNCCKNGRMKDDLVYSKIK